MTGERVRKRFEGWRAANRSEDNQDGVRIERTPREGSAARLGVLSSGAARTKNILKLSYCTAYSWHPINPMCVN